MNAITLLTLLSLAGIFALWFRLERAEFEHRRAERVRAASEERRVRAH